MKTIIDDANKKSEFLQSENWKETHFMQIKIH